MNMALIFLAILFLTGANSAKAIPLIPPNNIGYPVHVINSSGIGIGSGFYLRSEKGLFFVTAKCTAPPNFGQVLS